MPMLATTCIDLNHLLKRMLLAEFVVEIRPVVLGGFFFRYCQYIFLNLYVAIFPPCKKNYGPSFQRNSIPFFHSLERIFSNSSLYFITCLLSFLSFWRNAVNVFSLCPYHLPSEKSVTIYVDKL